jgi:hypothetical protein
MLAAFFLIRPAVSLLPFFSCVPQMTARDIPNGGGRGGRERKKMAIVGAGVSDRVDDPLARNVFFERRPSTEKKPFGGPFCVLCDALQDTCLAHFGEE